jgi:predicted  nucleic acid-binding Zn-ribbon protein
VTAVNNEGVKRALQPILAKKSEVAALVTQVADRQAEVKRVSEDEQRVRENLRALKGTSEEQRAVKRYAAELTQQEDRIDTIRREQGDLELKRRQANDQLQQLVDGLALDILIDTL